MTTSTSKSPLLENQQVPIKPNSMASDSDNIDAVNENEDPEKQPINVDSKPEEKPRSPLISFAVVIIILGIAAAIAYPTETYYECIVAYGVNYISFLCVAWPLHTEKFYDFTGMIAFLACILFSILYREVPWNENYVRNIVLFFMIMVWTLRLGIMLFKRIITLHAGKDARFDPIRNNFGRFLAAFTLQGTWNYFCTMPLFIVNSIDNSDIHNGETDITPQDYIGWALFVIGWTIEILADRQKSAFKADPANRGKFTNTGSWAYSRHPNYFGEILLWWGIAISATSIARNAGWLLFLAPWYTMMLLIFVSGVPMAERKSMEKYGKVDGYIEYTKKVPVLVPFCYCWTCYT